METINGIKLKEAETRNEKILLGFLNDESKRMRYGEINLVIKVRDSKIRTMRVIEGARDIKLD